MSIFLRRWPDALRPSENSIQSHMVSYCSAIKAQFGASYDQKGHRKWGKLTRNFWGKLVLGVRYPVSALEPHSEQIYNYIKFCKHVLHCEYVVYLVLVLALRI